jgi:hypothetical protein
VWIEPNVDLTYRKGLDFVESSPYLAVQFRGDEKGVFFNYRGTSFQASRG